MKNKNSAGLPNEIFIPFVESLYANRGVVIFGVITQTIIALAINESTGDRLFAWFAVAFGVIGCLRLLDSFLFDRDHKRPDFAARAESWETRYTIGASVIGALIGFMTYWAIRSEDSFAEFAAMSLTMAAMVTIVGKNFASKKIVWAFSAFAFGPTAFALLQAGGWKHVTGAVFLIPLAMSISSMSRYLREFLMEAVQGRHDIKKIADRLDIALNNMPQGLILFDNQHRAVVVNKRAVDMLRVPSMDSLAGRHLDVILRFCRFNGIFNGPDVKDIEQRLANMLLGADSRKFQLRSRDGGTVEFSGRQAGPNGGVLIFEDITERVQAEEKINRMARFDTLSGLPNRSYFRELARSHLAKAEQNSHSAFFAIDIDDFKHVNDSLGHPVGDELLCRFADRLNLIAGDGACFSRFGGDEFVGLLIGYESAQSAEFAARRVLSSLIGNYDVANHHLAVTISAGIVVTRSDAFDIAQLMVKSDLALYESKSRGKGISTLFAEAMDERYQRRQRLKTDLKSAIRERKLKVFYQPIISAETMQIATCEALCRWDHPELGPISPAIFIPLAEETGAISDLTRFMLEQACEDCKTWQGDISVAVNLSAIDFRNSQIAEMVRVALARSRLEPGRLEVEVTEGAILEDQYTASALLKELKKSGVRIALDDFGTGYSSLSYLHNLPLDKVKIDQSFVREIVSDDRSLKLVAGVTRLARELGLIVTVEGIETLEQFERLKGYAHIDLAQGFLFGAALSANGIATLISNTQPARDTAARREYA